MTNEERDNMLTEMYSDIKMIKKQSGEHHTTLFGNGQPGLAKDVTVLQERQASCPGRLAGSLDNKRVRNGNIMIMLTFVTLVVSIVFQVLSFFL